MSSQRSEILALRAQAAKLEAVLEGLRDERLVGAKHWGKWRRRAVDQLNLKQQAIHENERLRRALAECRQLSNKLSKVFRNPLPTAQSVGSLEENEWKLDALGFHPERRGWNVEKIMERMFQRLSTWRINSGLEEASTNLHFTRMENRNLSEKTIELEVVLCRRVYGNFVDVAAAVWELYSPEEVRTISGTTVHTNVAESFTKDTHLRVSSLRLPQDGRWVARANYQLSQLIVEDGRVVIMWKSVREDPNESFPGFTVNTDGWMSFERSFDYTSDVECCVVKLSSVAQLPPITSRARDLVMLVEMMNLATDPCVPEPSRHCRSLDVQRARCLLADFVLESMWQHSAHVEAITARVGSSIFV